MADPRTEPGEPWQRDVFNAFTGAQMRQIAYVPDAGLSGLIDLCESDESLETTVLTTEEEGIGLLAGAWLGGRRGALLMQGSGIGNCINTLGLARSCQFPLLIVATMRGEWHEFNPWQVPMAKAGQPALEAMGCIVERAEDADSVGALIASSAAMAFEGGLQIAVLIPQRLIGRKDW
ncbi:MAG: phosphonopyruvate decarboxylase [Alphaproteobacteria bacterium]